MLTGLLCLLTLLRFTRPRLPTRLLEVPSTLSEPMLLTTLTTMLDWWDTPMELLSQWSPLMCRLPELSILKENGGKLKYVTITKEEKE